MKKDILKIAGVKSEAEFYKKFPSEADFMAKHGGAFMKAKMGASMVKKQLTQLTDFSNPPQAQSGWHSEWDQDPYAQYSEINSDDAYLAKVNARNVAESLMKAPPINVAKSSTQAKKPSGSSYSIVDYLNSKGAKSDFNSRKALAESKGIKNYKGTAEQNMQLLSLIKGKPTTAQKATQKATPAPSTQKKETPAQTKTAAAKTVEKPKLSKAEEYIAKDPYFFAEESDPGWIKTIDAPFAGLRNLGARMVLDRDPMAALELLAMGAMSNSIIGQTKTMPYNPMQIPEAVGAARAASKALPYATRALPGFDMGGYIPQALDGQKIGGLPPAYQYDLYDPYSGKVNNAAKYNKRTGMIDSPTGQVSMADTQRLGFGDNGKKSPNRFIKDLNANDIQSGVQMTSALGKNYQKISTAIEEKKKAKRLNALSPIVLQASGTRPEEMKRRYVRPEDNIVDPGQISSPYGTGMDFLQMAYGGSIGGNPTEIQNMYNPGDIYSDMGYEPLSESDVVKQYRRGGGIPKAQGGELIMEGINTVGDLAAGIIGIETKKLNKQSQQRLGQAAFQSGMQDLQENQYSGFMEDGGEVGLKYLSHDWQPQVITQFGGYDMKDLLKDDPTMDTLRAGGHLKNYTAPSARAMSTERPMMQMGGELQTHWGGGAETISQNPFLPGDGETIMFRGQSHDESDGKGRTGIGITYGDNPVEVERGEPAVKLQDGGEEENLVVYGNMKIPSYGVSELNDTKAKGKKFKNYVNDLSKMEVKQNKIINKAISGLNSDDVDDPYKLLSFNSNTANLTGAYMKLKDIAQKKQLAAGIQNAILDTAGEYGLDSDSLAKGKIKQASDSDMAKFGGKFIQAQPGINQPLTPILPMSTYYRIDPKPYSPMVTAPETKKKLEQKPIDKKTVPKGKAPVKKTIEAPKRIEPFTSIDVPRKLKSAADMDITPKITAEVPDYAKNLKSPTELAPEEKFDWMDIYRQAQPYLIPSNQEALDPAQLAPEMFALAANQLEPVQAQTFQPMLEEMPTVSFQDQLNEIQAEANAARRMAGTNPAAQAMISSQAAAAKNKVLGEQLRTNQAMQAESRRRNLGVLNDATLKNLNILDQQYQRQAQAKSATKAQAQSALSSIADKIAKNKLENKTLGVYENMYNYRFGPKGRAYNVNAPMDFNTQLASMSTEDIQKMLDQKKAAEKKSGKNGSIVKAIKNL